MQAAVFSAERDKDIYPPRSEALLGCNKPWAETRPPQSATTAKIKAKLLQNPELHWCLCTNTKTNYLEKAGHTYTSKSCTTSS